ncbi:MAG: His/Gly/Thr/Pro-type tRNA ligase C-terminal domain-containing protein, partial [Parachlamydiaceae bacterium]
PESFQLEYTDQDGSRKRPVMIHRAIYGSLERFFGILIEHFAGKFPLWLSPSQIRIVTVSDKHVDYARALEQEFKKHKFNVKVDDSNESVGKKIRNAQLDQTNYMITIGDKELENKSINIRTRDNVIKGEMDPAAFIDVIAKERDLRSLTSLLK